MFISGDVSVNSALAISSIILSEAAGVSPDMSAVELEGCMADAVADVFPPDMVREAYGTDPAEFYAGWVTDLEDLADDKGWDLGKIDNEWECRDVTWGIIEWLASNERPAEPDAVYEHLMEQ